MDSYSKYTAEELAQDDFFCQWVHHPDSETNRLWTEFLIQYPEKQSVIVSAKALLKAVERIKVVPTQEQSHRMWMTIQDQIQEDHTTVEVNEPRVFQIGFRSVWAVAATVMLLIGLGLWFLVKPERGRQTATFTDPTTHPVVVLVEKRNETNQPLTVWLNDSSRVVLQPQSEISYPEWPAVDKREVNLVGEGFFEVVKNAKKPFMVYANGLVTQVVGTSFRVKAVTERHQVTVAVRTGKVAVFTIKAFRKAQERQEQITNMLLLTPNQQALFDKNSERITKSLVSEPALIRQPENKQYFVFDNTPVTDVFRTLEESYGVEIRYDSDLLKRCNVTAPLGNEPLFRKLDIICQTIGATYEVNGTQIIISGKGCS